MLERTVAMVMAGGMGERLRPLTDVRTKPSVPFGGIYRLIDFTLSNCINSGIRKVFVLTQYKSHSLSTHLKTGWSFLSRRLDQFIDEIPAQMQLGDQWYKGTADAIRQNLSFLERNPPRLVMILTGDHIYKMDYRRMAELHVARGAGLTVSAVRTDPEEARGTLGVMEVDGDGRIVGFQEKPAEPRLIPGTRQCLSSMGIYVFDYEMLRRQLQSDLNDFGHDVIPAMVAAGEPVFAYDFTAENHLEEYEYHTRDGQRIKSLVSRASDSDYWRDVGTLESYWRANLDLVAPAPRFNLYGEKWPVFNSPQYFPPAKFVHEGLDRTGEAINSIVANGVIISGSKVRNSVLSPGIFVHSYSLIENSVLMGGSIQGGLIVETSIGRHCRVRNAIIDKNVTVPSGTVIGYSAEDDERRGFKVAQLTGSNEYLVVVPKNYRFS